MNPSKREICLKIQCNDNLEPIIYLLFKEIFNITIYNKTYTIICGREFIPCDDVNLLNYVEKFKLLQSISKAIVYYPFNSDQYQVN